MDIAKIDKNFKIETKLSETDIVWYDASRAPFVIYGTQAPHDDGYAGDYIRIPRSVAKSVNTGVAGSFHVTAGFRARFRTDSPYVAIKVEWPWIARMSHMPASGSSGFDLYRYNSGKQLFCGSYRPAVDAEKGFEAIVHIAASSGGMEDYILNFPPYNAVSKLYIGVKTGSEFAEPAKYAIDKPVVFYGSSITQGGCASRPGNIYQNFLSRALDIDYINLGFSGNAKGEPAIAEYMAGLEMSAFVSDYDYNAPDVAHLERTHYALYETIRRLNPEIPYVMISHPVPQAAERNVGRHKAVMESYIRALENGDGNVYYIDGEALFSGDESDNCTVDGCHPNDIGFYRMAKSMLEVLRRTLYR